MKPSKNKTYYCQQCRSLTGTYHEIIFGHGNRQIAIDNNIQVPICQPCHALAHKHKETYQRIFLEWLGLDYWQTIRAFNDRSLRSYLEIHKDDCENRIKALEI